MPTFPNHFAGVSGTIEANETPHQAAQRELFEETSLTSTVDEHGGLFLDVPHISKRTQQKTIIRVYPFVTHVPDDVSLELRGTEHDEFKFVSVEELIEMESKCVPGLVQAFHHATKGQFKTDIPDEILQWASDKENGASVLTKNALELVHARKQEDSASIAAQISMLRPSMVSIVNVMHHILENGKDSVTVASYNEDIDNCVKLGRNHIETLQSRKGASLKIATFSRSGTLMNILRPFTTSCEIICSQSTPGDEGVLMATDLSTTWIPDGEMEALLSQEEGGVDVLFVGSDCIMSNQMVNKVGTRKLCEIARANSIPVLCCADRWKRWDDTFPPPLEIDLFEFVPMNLISDVVTNK